MNDDSGRSWAELIAEQLRIKNQQELAMLLTVAADELAWLHREYMSLSPLSEGVPRITRLLQRIEAHTGHATASPYP